MNNSAARNLNYEYDAYEYELFQESEEAIEYDYYESLATKLDNSKEKIVQEKYIARKTQSPIGRFLSAGFMIAMAFALILPFSYIVYRNAKIHERQNNLYKLNVAASDYRTKTNEIKERLESETSLDDLEIYATEELSMVKSDNSKVIILSSVDEKIITPRDKFKVKNLSNNDELW